MAAQLGVVLDSLAGTGPNGRIVKSDVQQQAASTAAAALAPDAAAPSLATVVAEPSAPQIASALVPPVITPQSLGPPVCGPAAQDRSEPLTRLQRTIVDRMVRSRSEVPDFTVSVDIDAAPLAELRAQLKAASTAQQPVASFNDLIIKAVAVVLRAHPRANASYSDGSIVFHERVNVGFAVAGQDALLVPVVHDADLKSLGQITRETRALAERAREGRISPAELDGGTFTISNLGMYGMRECIPVINGSQAAILGVGALRREPVVCGDELTIGQRIRLTAACDHRILYGADAAKLLDAVRSALEHPLSFAL
jgi:pyruvate dehydrogenase E2 component (dihydrolipoamide acetyltransferase)